MRMWSGGKLLCEDLLRKQRVSVLNRYIERHKLIIEKKLTKNKQTNKLTFSCQQSKTVYPLAKIQVALNRVSAAQKQAKTVLHKVGRDTPMTTISLSQINSWSGSDSHVPLSVLR